MFEELPIQNDSGLIIVSQHCLMKTGGILSGPAAAFVFSFLIACFKQVGEKLIWFKNPRLYLGLVAQARLSSVANISKNVFDQTFTLSAGS